MPSDFPLHSLVSRSGELHAFLFENPAARVPLGLFWRLRVEFEPLVWQSMPDEHIEPCFMDEFAKLPIQRVSDLATASSRLPASELNLGVYLLDWEATLDADWRFSNPNGDSLNFEWTGDVDLSGYPASDDEYGDAIWSRAAFACRVQFTGVQILPDVLLADPGNTLRARELISRFISLEGLLDPAIETRDWGGPSFVMKRA